MPVFKVRSGRSLLLLVSVSLVALLSLYWFDCFPYAVSSREKYNERQTSSNVRLQEVSAVDPCICPHHDSSDARTSFESAKFPLSECCHPSVGNGFLATVVYSDTLLMNGLYNGQYGNSHRARIPSTASVGYQLPANISAKSEKYTLNVEQGVFIRFTQLGGVNITQRIYAHQYYNRLLVNDITVARNPGPSMGDFVLTLSNNTGSPSEDISFTNGSSGRAGVGYVYGNTVQAETNTSSVESAHVFWTLIPPSITLQSTEVAHTWTFVTAVSNTSSDALAFYDAAQSKLPRGTLFESHRDIWVDKWNRGRIDIDGDLSLAKAIYGSMYYLLSSLPPLVYSKQPRSDFWFYGLSPSSLANGDDVGGSRSYHGHVFWDQETWMYPPILMFHPDLAKRMLGARTMHMGAAAQMAKMNGYDGIKFPWEMAYSGYEVCPAPPYGSNELHINGDIALAIQQYLQLTADANFLTEEGGMELIEGLAKFWASKAEYDSKSDSYSIRNVMGPDEYHKSVNNSVYTNSIAQISLRLPSVAAKLVTGYTPNPEWGKIADRLVILFDKKRNYHPEFEGYTFATRIKQADAILLGYPLLVNMTRTARENDLRYYDTVDGYHVTDINGPAMTWSMYVIGWLELGNQSMAAAQLKKSLLNIQQPYKIWTEEATSFGAVNFITGMGGFLQSIISGYGGFRIWPDALTFNVTLPPSSDQFNITGVYYMGNKLSFRVNRTAVMINMTSSLPTASDLEVVIDGSTYQLKTAQPVVTRRAPGEIRKTAAKSSPGMKAYGQEKIKPGHRRNNPSGGGKNEVLEKYVQLGRSKSRNS